MPRDKVLLIRPGAMGDVCLALPLARALARHCEVSWLIRPHYAPLLSLFADVDVQPLPTDLTAASLPALQARKFDVVLDLSHWPEVSRLVAGLDDVPIRAITHDPDQDQRLGVARPGIDLYAPFNVRVPVSPRAHQTSRWLTLAREAMGKDLTLDLPLPPRPAPRRRLRLFVHAHAAKASKVWPLAGYVRVISQLARERPLECWLNAGNRQEWLRSLGLCLLLRAHGVQARLVPRDRNYRRLAQALSGCDLALGGDSGPMHLAALLGVPTVVLFGPYAAWEFGPLWRSRHVSPEEPGQPAALIDADAVLCAIRESTNQAHICTITR